MTWGRPRILPLVLKTIAGVYASIRPLACCIHPLPSPHLVPSGLLTSGPDTGRKPQLVMVLRPAPHTTTSPPQRLQNSVPVPTLALKTGIRHKGAPW